MTPPKRKQPNQSDKLIYGFHPVMEALESGRQIEKIYLRQGAMFERLRELRELARTRNVPMQQVPDEKIRTLAGDGNHQGVVAVAASIAYRSLESVIIEVTGRGDDPLLLMLDGVTDVRNFGAIARTAECLGVHAIIIPTQGAASAGADAVRSSAGALNHLPVCRVDHLTDALMLMQTYNIRTVACTEKATSVIYHTDLSGPICLILGAEDKGITPQLLRRADFLAAIPLHGKIESLNVSVAAGIILSEALRRRSYPSN